MKRKNIWSSLDRYDDNVMYELKESIADYHDSPVENVTDEEAENLLFSYLNDERINLNKEVDGVIVGYAELGLWDGKHHGIKIFGSNIKEILHSNTDDSTWYADRYNIRGEFRHHDGTNYMLYRIAKNEEAAERLGERISNGNLTEEQFRKATRSLYKDVANVYGWA